MQKRRPFETQLTRLSLISSVPLLLLLLWVMIYADISIWLILLTALIGGLLVIYSNYRIHQKSAYQFRSLSNLLDAMIQGDYSLRARSDHSYGALDELVDSINGLAQRLSQQRMESVESQLLLRTVIEHIDVAIVALSEGNKISFVNPAAKKLLLLDETDSNTKLLDQLAFAQSFSSGCHQVVELSLGHQQGRFNVHVEEFRESGMQHKLLFITDVRTLLRSEERKAWQSLVRVISHEINNSLSPIASISQTLNRLIDRQGDSTENSKDIIEGLTIITERANGLSQFVDSYKQLAKLPEPEKQMVSILGLLEKICALFEGQSIVIESEVDVELFIDPVQFEQVLINLFKNAIEAMSQTNPDGLIRVEWSVTEHFLKLVICDQGGGISNPDNLFVPFYSTKQHGTGIGLVLCRQIIEAHNGNLSITNQVKSPGCCASIEIPFSQ
jgi:nitrogen fixation/metabolism regulation signal transduction histidine kinase